MINRKSIHLKKNSTIREAMVHWKYLAPLLTYPKNDTEYHLLAKRLDQLLDIVGTDENHPLMGLVDAVSYLIAAYDEANVKMPSLRGVSALKYLMEQHQLTQSDLHMIGSQGVVSEILNGKRYLNLRQIKLLANFFKVNPATFIDEIS